MNKLFTRGVLAAAIFAGSILAAPASYAGEMNVTEEWEDSVALSNRTTRLQDAASALMVGLNQWVFLGREVCLKIFHLMCLMLSWIVR